MDKLSDRAKWILVCLGTFMMFVFIFWFTMDEQLAMSTCLRHHSHDLCVYSLNR